MRSELLQWPTPSSLKQTTQLHAHLLVAGALRRRAALDHLLISIVDRVSGNLSYALAFLSSLSRPSTFLYNTLISACSSHFRAPKNSLVVHRSMHRHGISHDVFTFHSLFRSCALSGSVVEGAGLHALLVRSSPDSIAKVANSLIHMYFEFGDVDSARKVFQGIDLKDAISWTTMVAGLSKNALISDARKVFDKMPEKNLVSWTAMISGYSHAGQNGEAIELFKSMMAVSSSASLIPDEVFLTSVLSACAHLRDLETGRYAHKIAAENNISVTGNIAVSLIDMYSKCGDLVSACQEFDLITGNRKPPLPPAAWNALIDGYCKAGDMGRARSLFDKMGDSCNLITFNSMITGYTQLGLIGEALLMFSELQTRGLKLDKFTMVALLTACASSGALEQGRALHSFVVSSMAMDVFIGTALIDMYVKCGQMEQAMKIFHSMKGKDLQAWTSIVQGLAVNGMGVAALDLFERMKKEGIRPNKVAYIAVLSACSHSNLHQEGRKLFREMVMVDSLEPEVEHFGCMVDLLGRSGYLEEAMVMAESMPVAPNSVIWGSLLGSCSFYKNTIMAEKVARKLVEVDPQEDAGYVALSKVLAASGRRSEASEVRRLMEARGVRKNPGFSTVTIDRVVHRFVAGDRSHPEAKEVEEAVAEMVIRLRLSGYAPAAATVAADVEEEKEMALLAHS